MKKTFTTLTIIIFLSLAIWFFFYKMTPEAPLTSIETFLVVCVCGTLVYFVKWIIKRIKKRRKKNENNS